MTITLNALQKQRRDTASNWTSNNTVLLAGEFGYETDTEKLKIGDGSTAWQSLDYLPIPDTNRLLTGNLTVGGNFTVNGTTTTIDTTTLTVEDKNIEIGKVSSPTDTTADGGGISLLGTTTKTINWVDSTDSWTFSEHLDIATGKVFKINNTEVLSATGLGSSVVSSSLTSVGTIATGTWNATAIASSKLAKPIDFADNEKARFGSGNDLQIYHNGSNSYIQDVGTGNLHLTSNGTAVSIDKGTSENMAVFNTDGAVELYHDSSKKFETLSGGAAVSTSNDSFAIGQGSLSGGNVRLDLHSATSGVGCLIRFANDHNDDAYIGLAGDTTGDLLIYGGQDKIQIKPQGSAAVELYYGDTIQAQTTADGFGFFNNCTFSDNKIAKFGDSNDLQIYHDGNHSRIVNSTGNLLLDNSTGVDMYLNSGNDIYIRPQGSENGIKVIGDGAVEVYYDGSKKLETDPSGVKFNDDFYVLDNQKGYFGTGNDLEIFHNGTSNTIISINGALYLKGDASNVIGIQPRNGENSALFFPDGAVELFYDGGKKLETHTNGISLSGDVRFNNSTWTGESSTGKIQTHSGHMYFQNASSSGSWVFRLSSGSDVANINSSGTYSSSDERRKKDITTITSAVDTIKKLTGRSFTWKEDNKKSFGVIAQEVETVLPDLITTQTVLPNETNSDPYKMVNYSALTGYFIEAVKELSTEVETLKAKVAALEAA